LSAPAVPDLDAEAPTLFLDRPSGPALPEPLSLPPPRPGSPPVARVQATRGAWPPETVPSPTQGALAQLPPATPSAPDPKGEITTGAKRTLTPRVRIALAVVAMVAGAALLFGTPGLAVSPKPATVEVHIAATPQDAHLTLDGRPIPNPFEGVFPLDPDDGTSHMIVAQAEGYERKVKYIRYRGERVSEAITLVSDEAARSKREADRQLAATEVRETAEHLATLRKKVKGRHFRLEPDSGCLSKGLPPYNRSFEGGTFAENEQVAKAEGCVHRWPGAHNQDTPLANLYCCPR
jgi:hypothetical protein